MPTYNNYLISDLQKDTSIQFAFTTTINSKGTLQKCLALWRGFHIEFYKTGNGELKLIDMGETFVFIRGADVLPTGAISFEHHPGKESRIAYWFCKTMYISRFHFFHLQDLESIYIEQPLSSSPLETDVIILADPRPIASYLVAHLYQGYIHYIPFDHHWTKIHIGSITVSHMTLLKGDPEQVTLAVLYRDFEFNYSLRYYTLDSERKTFFLLEQFEEFEVQPTGLLALSQGGVLVFSGVNAFYFAEPKHSLTISSQNSDYSMSINSSGNILTKVLLDYVKPDQDLAQITTSTVVDDDRVLVTSKSGVAYMIYLNFNLNKKNMVVENFEVIKLNYTTNCKKLLYLGEGEFFAVSHLSRSVLFTVIPSEPYVHILSYMKSSPPVLNIDVHGNQVYACQGGYESGEFRNTSRAPNRMKSLKNIESDGNLGTKLVIFNKSREEMKYEIGVLNDGVGEELESSMVEHFKIKESKLRVVSSRQKIAEEIPQGILNVITYKNMTYYLTTTGLLNGKQKIFEGDIVTGHIEIEKVIFIERVNGDEYSLVLLDIETSKTLRFNFTFSQKKNGKKKLRQLVDLKLVVTWSNSLIILVTFNDTYHIIAAEDGQELLTIFNAEIELVVSTAIVKNEADRAYLWLFFTLANGKLSQQKFNIEKLEIDPFSSVTLNVRDSIMDVYEVKSSLKGMSGFKFNITSHNDTVLLYGSEYIDILTFNEWSHFYEIKTLSLKRKFIADISIVNSNSFIILYDDSAIEFLRLPNNNNDDDDEEEEGDDTDNTTTLFSNMLSYKSIQIQNGKFALVLCFEFEYSELRGEFEKIGYLKLIDLNRMKPVEEFSKFRLPCKDAVDICSDGHNKEQFMILDNNPLHPILFLTFIDSGDDEGNKKQIIINKQETNDISELEGIKFQSIKYIEGARYLISGSKIFIVEVSKQHNEEITWNIASKIIKQKVFTSESAVNGNIMAVMDVLSGVQLLSADDIEDNEGIEEDNYGKTSLKLRNIGGSLLYGNFFSTAMTVCQSKDKTNIFFGVHQLGEIRSLEFETNNHHKALIDEELPIWRCGSQINTLQDISRKASTIIEYTEPGYTDPNLGKVIIEISQLAVLGTAGGGIQMICNLAFNLALEQDNKYKPLWVQDLTRKPDFIHSAWKSSAFRNLPDSHPDVEGMENESDFYPLSTESILDYLRSLDPENIEFGHCFDKIPLLRRIVFETDKITNQEGRF